MLRPILGKPMIFWTLNVVRASGFSPQDVIVVIGYNVDLMRSWLQKYDSRLNIVENPNYKNEMFSSIKAGIYHLPEDTRNVLIVLEISSSKPETIKAILRDAKSIKVVQPVYKTDVSSLI